MFDLRDLYALPIAFSLTLWDAVPIYLSVSLALAILVRTILRGQALHMAWQLREIIAIEGLLYLAMFRPSLVPVLLISSVVATMLHLRSAWHDAVPITQGDALKTRLGELFPALLISCLAAAIMKVFAPGVPDHLALQTLLAASGSVLVGGRSGTSGIPAVAIAVHFGGVIPASAWIVGATTRTIVNRRRDTVLPQEVRSA